MTIISTRLYEAAKAFRTNPTDPASGWTLGSGSHDQAAELLNAWNAAGNGTSLDAGYILTQVWSPSGQRLANQWHWKSVGIGLASSAIGGLAFGPMGALAALMLGTIIAEPFFRDTE